MDQLHCCEVREVCDDAAAAAAAAAADDDDNDINNNNNNNNNNFKVIQKIREQHTRKS